jgi:hypothetical protein
MTPELPSWPTTLQPLALVASPRLGLQQIGFVNSTFMVSKNFLGISPIIYAFVGLSYKWILKNLM